MFVISAPWLLPALLSAGTFGCVVPPPLEIGGADAGPSANPAFVSASPSELAFPGPNTIDRGPIIVDRGDQRRLSLTLTDADLDDTLYVRIYVNYGTLYVNSSASDCSAPPSGELTRVADCSIASFCNLVGETDTSQQFVEAVVADREFLSESDPRAEGQPPFRALPEDAAYSFRSWPMVCSQPQ